MYIDYLFNTTLLLWFIHIIFTYLIHIICYSVNEKQRFTSSTTKHKSNTKKIETPFISYMLVRGNSNSGISYTVKDNEINKKSSEVKQLEALKLETLMQFVTRNFLRIYIAFFAIFSVYKLPKNLPFSHCKTRICSWDFWYIATK